MAALLTPPPHLHIQHPTEIPPVCLLRKSFGGAWGCGGVLPPRRLANSCICPHPASPAHPSPAACNSTPAQIKWEHYVPCINHKSPGCVGFRSLLKKTAALAQADEAKLSICCKTCSWSGRQPPRCCRRPLSSPAAASGQLPWNPRSRWAASSRFIHVTLSHALCIRHPNTHLDTSIWGSVPWEPSGDARHFSFTTSG